MTTEEQTFKAQHYTGKVLERKQFSHCHFEGCPFDEASFLHSTFSFCRFVKCQLSLDRLEGCRLQEVVFEGGKLVGIEASFEGADLEGTLFHKCNLTKSNFVDAKNYAINPLSNQIGKARFSTPEALSLLRGFDIELI